MEIIEFIAKVQSISKIGQLFSTDPYAIENYEELNKLSLEMLDKLDGLGIDNNIYTRNIYPTPNVSVRVLVINPETNELLFVKETREQKWSVPGGWCDVFETARMNACKEVKQESGIEVDLVKILAVFDRNIYKPKKSLISEYVIYFLATPLTFDLNPNHETDAVAWYKLDNLPQELSTKNTIEELSKALDVYQTNSAPYFD